MRPSRSTRDFAGPAFLGRSPTGRSGLPRATGRWFINLKCRRHGERLRLTELIQQPFAPALPRVHGRIPSAAEQGSKDFRKFPLSLSVCVVVGAQEKRAV